MKRFYTFAFPLLLIPALLITGCGAPRTIDLPPAPTETQESVVAPFPTETTTLPASSDPTQPAVEIKPFTLSSPAFKDGADMADKYAYKMGGQCNGENYSPALEWTGVPAGTKSFALTVIDPDGGNWVHWLQFNLPAETSKLPETIGGPDVGIKGQNDFGAPGYGGPCPPGGTHRYVFTLYALDTTLDLKEGAKLKDLQAAMKDHILAEAQLTGLRTR